MDISLVILTWNSDSYFEHCFESVVSSLRKTNLTYEIFIVDNGSKDKTVDILKKYESDNEQIHTIYLDDNVGTTRSRNLALKKCRGEYICILDSDVEIRNNVFDGLISRLSDNEKIGIVVPKIRYPSGKWQKSIDQFPTLLHKLKRYLFLRHIEDNEGTEFSDDIQDRMVDYAISAFWLIKSSLLEDVGLLDENYFYAPEDVDYCLSAWKSGYGILYCPSFEIVHHTQEISRGIKLNKAKKEHIKGLAYYFRKHGYFFNKPTFDSNRNVDHE